MTFQELREVGLITMQNGIYYITEKGKKYVSCVNQSKYTKNDLRNIIKG
jgi:predicted transcriptional regulator